MSVRVLRHERIHTGDRSRPRAQAIAIEDGTIVAVGTQEQVRSRVGRDVELVDLDGAAVLPGFVDAHVHSGLFSRGLVSVDLRGATSSAECARRVAAHARGLQPGEWMFGGAWDANLWPDGDAPDRRPLDEAAPGHPVALMSGDFHSMWANTHALRAVGIDASTPDPPGGHIVRDERGEPTGLLLEAAAHPLQDVEASPAGGDLRAQLRRGQERLLAAGITALTDFDGEDVREAYAALHADGLLHLRVDKGVRAADLELAIAEGRRTGDGDAWLRTGPVKIFSDGALGSHTCHMHAEFAGEPGNRGIEVTPPEELDRLVSLASRHGLAVATHAIGDRANELVLDAYARTRGLWRSLPAPRIEHAQHLAPASLPRMARLGVVASMQPAHCPSDIDLVDSLLGGSGLLSYAWRSVLDAGVPLAFGSDTPVETYEPFEGIGAAVTRSRPDGTPAGGWQPHERLTVAEALTAYTSGAARAFGPAWRCGALAEGFAADLVVVDRDPFDEPAAALREIRVVATFTGGERRWGA